MAAIDFPASPTTGQLFSAANGVTYRWDGTLWLVQFGTGSLLQSVSFETGALATGTTVFPLDDTIPQQTEGDQYMTLAITPKSATSKLVIDVTFNGAINQSDLYICIALFQDATANALAAAAVTNSHFANVPNNIKFTHTMTSGTTSTTTFKVRAGPYNTGTVTFNGSGGARLFGGVCASSIVIREEAP